MKERYIFFAVLAASVMPFMVLAETAAATPLPANVTEWLTIGAAVLYGLAHARTMLPDAIRQKCPSWLMKLLDLFMANYGKAKNKDG